MRIIGRYPSRISCRDGVRGNARTNCASASHPLGKSPRSGFREITPSAAKSRFRASAIYSFLEEHQKCRRESASRQRASAPSRRLKPRRIHCAAMIHPKRQLYHSRRKSIHRCGNSDCCRFYVSQQQHSTHSTHKRQAIARKIVNGKRRRDHSAAPLEDVHCKHRYSHHERCIFP
jgi:hypothetical protein